ncbi:hypothetical protein [Bacillus dakarensis]|uniref:hypothetical protein n=1 Tax=Robertmurraya dakarensis TaxID=1926278 RepID=UPI0009819B9E|nr:hypothetical protein [Bacillus dakarensis]
MGRLISILLIGVGGYLAFQNRFRLINIVFGNRMIRRFFVTSLMSLPFFRSRMMSTVFSEPANW